MSQRAITVVRLLEELRRLNAPESEQNREAPSNVMQQSPDDPRPPKRPWEDIDDTPQPNSENNTFAEVCHKFHSALDHSLTFFFLKKKKNSNSNIHHPMSNHSRQRSRIWSLYERNVLRALRVPRDPLASRKASTASEV